MPRNDIDYPHEADFGDYGILADVEWYCVPPGIVDEYGEKYFIYLERAAVPPWVVTENVDETITVTPSFSLGLRPMRLIVELKDGIWTSLGVC